MIIFSDLSGGNIQPGRTPFGDDVSINAMRVPGATLAPVATVSPEPGRTTQPVSPAPNTSITVSPQQLPRAIDIPPLVKPTTNLPLVPGQLVASPTIPTQPANRPSLTMPGASALPSAPVAAQPPQPWRPPPTPVALLTRTPAKSKTWMWILGGVVAAAGVGVTVYAVTRKPAPRRRRSA